MRFLILMISGLLLASCAQHNDIDYCNRMGVGQGTAQFNQCIAYFYDQQALFNKDLAVCSARADQTYPQTLYDRGSYGIVRGGLGYGGWGGLGYGGAYGAPFFNNRMVDIPPNHQHNAQVDALRMRIIEPCMREFNWNSGASWEAGRRSHAPSSSPAGLPWLHR